MAKLSKEEQARREGMSYALRVAREKGIDGLEEGLSSDKRMMYHLRYLRQSLSILQKQLNRQ